MLCQSEGTPKVVAASCHIICKNRKSSIVQKSRLERIDEKEFTYSEFINQCLDNSHSSLCREGRGVGWRCKICFQFYCPLVE